MTGCNLSPREALCHNIRAMDILEQLATAKDGAYAINMHQRVVFWNHAAERILGYRAEEVLNRRCFDVLGGTSEKEHRVCTANCSTVVFARRGEVAPSQTILARTKDGKSKWLSIVHILVPSPSRDAGALVHIFHDTTEEVEAKRLVSQFGALLAQGRQAPQASPCGSEPLEALTAREIEVLRLLSQGLGTKEIARQLVVQPITVRNHVQRLLAKLDVHNRLEAVAAASARGLL